MLHTKEKTVSTHPRSAADKRRASYFGYASEPTVAPSRRETPVRKPTAAPNGRLARSEARLITAAIGATVAVCGVLVLYLCSYAHIASLGIHEAQARVHLRQVQADNETLLAQYATLRSPEKISVQAKSLNMQNIAPSVSYIDLTRASDPVEADASGVDSNVSNNNRAEIKVADRGTTGEKSESTRTL